MSLLILLPHACIGDEQFRSAVNIPEALLVTDVERFSCQRQLVHLEPMHKLPTVLVFTGMKLPVEAASHAMTSRSPTSATHQTRWQCHGHCHLAKAPRSHNRAPHGKQTATEPLWPGRRIFARTKHACTTRMHYISPSTSCAPDVANESAPTQTPAATTWHSHAKGGQAR